MSITQFQGVSSLRGLRGLVDNNGQPTDAMIAWMTKVERTVTQLGVTAKALTAPPRVANIDPAGVVQAAGVDFTIAYTNKSLSNVPDGAARKAVLAVDANQRPLIDFTQAHLAKNLLNVADDPGGGRSAWATAAQKTAAVDGSGNLLLKNIQNVPGVTSGPTTSSTTPAVIPELTTTFSTKGNNVFVSFCLGFANSTTGGSAFTQIYVDGVAAGPEFLGSSPNVAQNETISGSWIVTGLAAASHTFAIYWWVSVGTTCTGNLTNRVLQAIELG